MRNRSGQCHIQWADMPNLDCRGSEWGNMGMSEMYTMKHIPNRGDNMNLCSKSTTGYIVDPLHQIGYLFREERIQAEQFREV